MDEVTGEQVLACPMDEDNDAEVATVGAYLVALGQRVWDEGEGFSGKRPFGNSDWEHEVFFALAKAGLIPSTHDRYDGLDYNSADGRVLVARAFGTLRAGLPAKTEEGPSAKQMHEDLARATGQSRKQSWDFLLGVVHGAVKPGPAITVTGPASTSRWQA